ncbi:hypothetical protein [Butyrivibrio sp. AE2032]|uniref:hypothetical protein n=1 Tax=Butyrivibrio sp. AE2032 TaxID=1458463 RepID=UPI0005584925|nr:hypothetical protein [Butyrivibrio sp. AE2032]
MFGKRFTGKLAAAILAGIMVIGAGMTVLADEKIVTVEEKELLFRSYCPEQTFEFIPEYTGEYIFRSGCDAPTSNRIVDPWIKVEQGDNTWYDFDSAPDGFNFKLRVHLEAGVPCEVQVQCQGYFTKYYMPVLISRVETEPEENAVPELTEEQIAGARFYLKIFFHIAYADEDVTWEEIDEAIDALTVEEIIDICEEIGYKF